MFVEKVKSSSNEDSVSVSCLFCSIICSLYSKSISAKATDLEYNKYIEL